MKSVAEIAIIGLIGTVSIIAGIVIPPAVMKSTVGKELLLSYNFEKAQHGLLSLLSSTQNDKPVYELISTKIIIKNSDYLSSEMQNIFAKAIGANYCILVDSDEQRAQKDAFTGKVCEVDTTFNTIIVVPYNKDSLVKVIGFGVK
ncbi:MAG: hypothetical protein AABW61_01935 [Candidatus Aenigmatarchaeota archaeon]